MAESSRPLTVNMQADAYAVFGYYLYTSGSLIEKEKSMVRRLALIALVGGFSLNVAAPQENVTLKTAVVTLSAQPQLRAEFEEGLVAKALELNYDAVTSYDLVPDVTDVDDADFIDRLASHGIGAILMIRPAVVGAGSTLESVRDSVSPDVFSNMQAFARELSASGEEELLAVVHLGIYLISEDGAELLSAGAVWLDEPNPSREEAIERLQNLIVANVNGVRPAIRQHLGLPPLE